MSNTIWKKFELFIARALGTERNMGSGRVNRCDDGEARAGDVVTPKYWDTLIECKTRKTYPKSGVWSRIQDTIADANAAEKGTWFHFERKTGNKKVYILATNEEWILKICNYIGDELRRRENGSTSEL